MFLNCALQFVNRVWAAAGDDIDGIELATTVTAKAFLIVASLLSILSISALYLFASVMYQSFSKDIGALDAANLASASFRLYRSIVVAIFSCIACII